MNPENVILVVLTDCFVMNTDKIIKLLKQHVFWSKW